MLRMRFAIALALLLAPAPIVQAAEGRIPLLSLPGPPYVITQPGHYIMTRDIENPAGLVIRIESDVVTLDLNGHTVTGPSSFIDTAISVVFAPGLGQRGVTVRNGRIVSGAAGLSGGSSVSDTRGSIRLDHLEIVGSLDGIGVAADHVEITHCHIHDLATLPGSGAGISVYAYGGRIVDNLIQNVTAHGIWVGGLRGGEIRGNVVSNFGSTVALAAGIYVQDHPTAPGHSGNAVIADNIVSSLPGGMDDLGIYIKSWDNLIKGNVVSRNGRYGLYVWGGQNRIEENVANQNSDHGIAEALATTRNHFAANQAQGNAGCGLDFNASSGIVYRDNTLAGNAGGNVCGAAAADAGGNYCDGAPCP